MTLLTVAIVVGVLFATGTYLILHRRPIRLILGLGLLTHGVNLLLFSSGGLDHGLPPIVLDKKAFAGDISSFVDPLPQALILTAIVISFAVTAFTVVLVNRRHVLAKESSLEALELPSAKATDPFASIEHYASGLDDEPDDYEWLEFSLADELRARRAQRARVEAAKQAADENKPQSKHEGVPTEAQDSSDSSETHAQDGDLFTSEAFTSVVDENGDEDGEQSNKNANENDGDK